MTRSEEQEDRGGLPAWPSPPLISNFRAGFVALLGRPNVGKSSLVNRMLEDKLCIVSSVPQTTRHAIRCIRTTEHSQIIFVDTPGLHEPRTALGSYMVERVRKTLDEVDCLCLVLDARRPQGGEEVSAATVHHRRSIAPAQGRGGPMRGAPRLSGGRTASRARPRGPRPRPRTSRAESSARAGPWACAGTRGTASGRGRWRSTAA